MILSIGNWREFGEGLAVGELSLPIPSLKDMRLVVIREEIPGEEVWRIYNRRACCENFIKEDIYGFGLDKSVTRNRAGSRLYFELNIHYTTVSQVLKKLKN